MTEYQFRVRREPEHWRLCDYIRDNPQPPCPFVGLEAVTEFCVPGTRGLEVRPQYHCSLAGCYNEQGDSRQMFEHLVTLHHVTAWLGHQLAGSAVPEHEREIIIECKRLSKQLPNPQSLIRTIHSDVHHTKCKKARLRLTTAEAEKLAKSVAMSNVAKSHAVAAADTGAGSKSSKTVEDDGVLMIDSDTSQEDHSQARVAPPDPVTDVTDQSRDSHLEDGTMNVIKEELLTEVKQEAGAVSLKSLKLGSPKKAERKEVSTNKIASPDIQPKGISSPTNVRSNRLTIQDYKDRERRKDAEEIQIVGVKAGNSKQGSSNFSEDSATAIKRESQLPILAPRPADLLSRPEEQQQPQPVRIVDPQKVFFSKIVDFVKRQLNMYYARDKNDILDKAKNPKVIKIGSAEEYYKYCKQFSEQFKELVQETYEVTNGSLDGIENISVAEYGIEHDIHKFFSEKPVLKCPFDV